MRGLLVAAALVAAGCTPRDNRDADLELEKAPEAAVHAEPTVVGGAYDSIIYRMERERGPSQGVNPPVDEPPALDVTPTDTLAPAH